MLYNLIVINVESGINIATLKLAEEGLHVDYGHLMSGVVKAIKDLLEELELGSIETFSTQEKRVVIYKEGLILVALVCDDEDNYDIYLPKLRYVANLYHSHCDWENWCGEMNMFDELKQPAKDIFRLSDEEIIKHIKSDMKELMVGNPQIYGFKIEKEAKTIEEAFRDIDDFELSSLFTSNFINDLLIKREKYKNLVNLLMPKEDIWDAYLNFGRFSIYSRKILGNLYINVFLPGELNPLKDLDEYALKLKEVSSF